MSDLSEQTLETSLICEGSLLKVQRVKVLLPNGSQSQREIVIHPGAAAIIPVLDDGRYVLVRQFRKPVERVLWEIPAGKLDEGEPPLTCAQRELGEETGFQAASWEQITSILTTPGFSDEVIHIFVAKDLQPLLEKAVGDEDEFVEVAFFTEDQLRRMISSGELCDSKSLSGLCAYWVMRGEQL